MFLVFPGPTRKRTVFRALSMHAPYSLSFSFFFVKVRVCVFFNFHLLEATKRSRRSRRRSGEKGNLNDIARVVPLPSFTLFRQYGVSGGQCTSARLKLVLLIRQRRARCSFYSLLEL